MSKAYVNTVNNHEEWSQALYECLIPILREQGWYGSKEQLNHVLPMSISSLKIEDVVNALSGLRIAVKEKRIKLKNIDCSQLPCIFVCENYDPMVIFEETDFGLSVFNGLSKKKQIVKADNRCGLALFFYPVKDKIKTSYDSQQRWFILVINRFRSMIAYSMLISFIISILTISSPLFVLFLFSEISAITEKNQFSQLYVGIAIYIGTLFAFKMLRTFAQAYTSARIGNIVANQVVRRLFYLPPRYTEMASLEAQISRIRDFDSIKGFVAGTAMASLLEIPFIVFILGILLLIDFQIALIPITALVIFVGIGLIAKYWSRSIGSELSGASQEYQDFVVDTLTNLRVVKSLALSTLWIENYRKHIASSLLLNMKTNSFHESISHIASGLVSLTGLATIYIGVQRIFEGELTPAGLMASIMFTWIALSPIKTGFSVAIQFDKVKKSVEQVNRLMDLGTEHRSRDSVTVTSNIKGNIIFSQVSLRYNKEAYPSLLGVSFALHAGETLVIIGHGGSGTSSVLKLILGLYIPQSGRVIIDDNNLQQIDPIALRRQIAYMPEKPFFFNGTLRENLTLRNPSATREDFAFAIQEAGLQKEIQALPEGLDTAFDEKNISRFSLSFQRRFSLALVLIQQSQLWLFDNPGMGLEDIHERRILSTLEGAKGVATIVIATQNPEYLALADKVLWLEGGRMKSFGTLEQVSPSLMIEHT